MRITITSSLLVLLSLSIVSAQEEKTGGQSQKEQRIPPALAESEAVLKRWEANAPATLVEAHTALERMLSPQTLAEIDAMPSENDMIKYHFSLGLNIRNGWGLWRDSALAKHMQKLGFTHPDGMSSVILVTFWRKRHGQDLNLEELKAAAKKAAEAAEKARGENEKRAQEAEAAVRKKAAEAAEKALGEDEKHVQEAKAAVRNMVMMAFLSVILLMGGLACWILTRTSLYRQGIPPSFGPGLLSKDYARLDRIAYVLMGAGGLFLLLLWGALRTT